MEGWNLEQVKVLSEQYVAAGLGNTSSGRFLSSLVAAKAPPRGNGIKWLNDLIQKGDPGKFKDLLTEVQALEVACPTLALATITRALSRGDNLANWQEERLAQARAQVQEPHIDLTDKERSMVKELNVIMESRSNWYWSGRPAIYTRLRAVFDRVFKEQPIRRSDLEFTFDQFGPAVRELQNPTYQISDLVGVSGGLIGMVVSEPFAMGVIHYKVLVDGRTVELPVDSMRKRIKA